MSKGQKRVCIIIPAYNEAAIIYDVVRDIKKALQKTAFSSEIVVINDGSKDKTARQAQKGGATIVDHILNTGAGGATATGIRYAEKNGFDIAATMDADGQHASSDVIKGIELLDSNGVDLLVGSRLIDSTGMSKIKVFGNKGLSLITFLLFGINSTDSQSGLRIYSRHAIENLRWRTTSYEFCSEMLWRAKQQKMEISEYPIQAIYTDYSKGKGQNNWNAINIIKSLLKRRVMELFG